MYTQGGFKYAIPSLPQITFSLSQYIGILFPFSAYAQTVTMAPATNVPGMAIFYTLDGSYPTPRNAWAPVAGATSYLYTAPFVIPVGTIVRAKGYLPGFQPASTDSQLAYTTPNAF
jgi:hypothetical protein